MLFLHIILLSDYCLCSWYISLMWYKFFCSLRTCLHSTLLAKNFTLPISFLFIVHRKRGSSAIVKHQHTQARRKYICFIYDMCHLYIYYSFILVTFIKLHGCFHKSATCIICMLLLVSVWLATSLVNISTQCILNIQPAHE